MNLPKKSNKLLIVLAVLVAAIIIGLLIRPGIIKRLAETKLDNLVRTEVVTSSKYVLHYSISGDKWNRISMLLSDDFDKLSLVEQWNELKVMMDKYDYPRLTILHDYYPNFLDNATINILPEIMAFTSDNNYVFSSTYYLEVNGNLYSPEEFGYSDSGSSTSTTPSGNELDTLMQENGVTLTARDVQYNMPNNIEKLFGLEGTGELCDYYNWGYDDSIKGDYFCVRIAPPGGTLREDWYIYFNRTSFDKVYQDLLEGDIYIYLLAKIDQQYYDVHQGNQARAVSVRWRSLK